MATTVSASMFSTGQVQIRPEHVGPTKLPTLLWLLTSRAWTKPRPINVYVIKHPQGNIVFDTGQDIASVKDPEYFPKGVIGWLYSRLAKFTIADHESFESQLSLAGLAASDIKFAIISHLHQDHIGGLSAFQNGPTKVIVHQAEIEATKSGAALLDGYMNNHIFLPGLNIENPKFSPLEAGAVPGFSKAWDVFGDGSAILLEVAGHTEGSVALLVNFGQANPILFVGDLTYDANLLRAGKLPGVGKKSKLKEATNSVLELLAAEPNLTIAAAHDPSVRLP